MTAVTVRTNSGYLCMCQHCGIEFTTRGPNRRYCDKHWHKANRAVTPDPAGEQHTRALQAVVGPKPKPRGTYKQPRVAAWIEDIEWLIGQGECVAAICQHMQSKPSSIARRLNKHGRADLANYFWGHK